MCTRAVYHGPDATIISVRSMDWMSDLGSNLWIFPRGIQRRGSVQPGGIAWTSKYGSVVTSAFEAATVDGMNEKGLVANLLYLAESDFGDPQAQAQNKPGLCISDWTQYVLDNYATVAAAVKALKKETFFVAPAMSPDGHAGTVHLAITDPTGDTAIFEYVAGRLTIHHGPEFQVMTNSPIYDEQLALNKYWQSIGGTIMLPGTNRAADRFVRASFYISSVTKTADNREAVAAAFSVIRNVSVPRGISMPDQPNIASTLWRTVADHKNRRYYFESTRDPNVFWVDLDDVNFKACAPVRRLLLTDDTIYAGNVVKQFAPAEPFAYLSVTL
ncbi:MAG: linear amide C-N hydrolase [Caldilineaceae bacterium]